MTRWKQPKRISNFVGFSISSELENCLICFVFGSLIQSNFINTDKSFLVNLGHWLLIVLCLLINLVPTRFLAVKISKYVYKKFAECWKKQSPSTRESKQLHKRLDETIDDGLNRTTMNFAETTPQQTPSLVPKDDDVISEKRVTFSDQTKEENDQIKEDLSFYQSDDELLRDYNWENPHTYAKMMDSLRNIINECKTPSNSSRILSQIHDKSGIGKTGLDSLGFVNTNTCIKDIRSTILCADPKDIGKKIYMLSKVQF